MKTLNAIKADLNHHCGSEQFYHGLIKNSIYTEGVRDYFTQAECFWLSYIVSTEFHNVVKRLSPDTYYLTVEVNKEDSSCVITLDDYKRIRLHTRKVDYTTHPYGKMNLILGWDGARSILCLTNEN